MSPFLVSGTDRSRPYGMVQAPRGLHRTGYAEVRASAPTSADPAVSGSRSCRRVAATRVSSSNRGLVVRETCPDDGRRAVPGEARETQVAGRLPGRPAGDDGRGAVGRSPDRASPGLGGRGTTAVRRRRSCVGEPPAPRRGQPAQGPHRATRGGTDHAVGAAVARSATGAPPPGRWPSRRAGLPTRGLPSEGASYKPRHRSRSAPPHAAAAPSPGSGNTPDPDPSRRRSPAPAGGPAHQPDNPPSRHPGSDSGGHPGHQPSGQQAASRGGRTHGPTR